MALQKTIGTREAAESLGVTIRRVRQLILSGLLPAEQVGRDWRILPADLERVRVRPGRGRPPKQS